MTIGAGWYRTWFPFPKLASNDLSMDFLDPGMAFGAGPGDISRRNG
jgi:hypothetical protein